ncbi:MAG: hypothetical protein AAGU05_12840 [Anaerolineaceae bacterium]
MEFSTEIIVAIIVGVFSFGGSLLLYLKGAKKDEVDALRGIITELKNYVDDLEADKEDLQAWAEKLVCQVKDAGLEPAKFLRSPRARSG